MENNLDLVNIDGETVTEVQTVAEVKEAETLPFVTIDVWTIIFTWGNLLILFLLMKKFLFKPVRKMMLDRENEVKAMYDNAEKSMSDADNLKAEYESRLSSAKTEAEDIVKSATRNAALKSEEILADAHSRAQEIIERVEGAENGVNADVME